MTAQKTSGSGDERLQFDKEKAYRVPRTGDRDLQFVGKLIGYGRQSADSFWYHEAYIFRTKAGKYVAARSKNPIGSGDAIHTAEVCESPASVAQFFFISSPAAAPTRGKPLDTRPPYLCQDGKESLEKAAEYIDDFRALFMEDIE